MSDSMFAHMVEAAPDPILGTAIAFRADTHPKKVNLGVGAYRTEEGKPYVFKAVREAERRILSDPSLDKEYLAIDGIPELKKPTQLLAFGNVPAVTDGRIVSSQALSGTGAVRIAAEFFASHVPDCKVAYVSNPTWGNHVQICERAGLKVQQYPYWHAANKAVDFEGMMAAFRAAPPRSLLLLHSCAHNPTGEDLSREQWLEVLQVVKERGLIALMDTAYQGFASGDVEEDAWAIRQFEQAGLEFAVCQSFAKNIGLYGERIGMLHIVTRSAERAKVVMSQLKLVIRPAYSSPPAHGARILSIVLNDPALHKQWLEELKEVAGRIKRVRSDLRAGLEKRGTPGSWAHVTKQIGMFSYTGLSPEQCDRMIAHWHIYMLRNGRISLAGLNSSNIDYVADAIDDCARTVAPKL